MTKNFLVEIGTEELPPKALKSLALAFAEGIKTELAKHELQHGHLQYYASPRRLAVLVEQLDQQTPLKEARVWGPPATIAFDAEGKPTKAAEAFARKNGIELTALSQESDGKQEKLVHRKKIGGLETSELMQDVVSKALGDLPIPKRMRWGSRREEFVRPVHWLLMLMGDQVVDATVLGLKADRISWGHRFHYNREITIDRVEDYVQQLKSPGYVLADFEQRQQIIVEQVQAQAAKIPGHAQMDQDLLDEVTALVEWPLALTGGFDTEFLQVPAEALISSMNEHQKYFHVTDAQEKLLPYFITVANIESRDENQIIKGNERVIHPRLSDAAFFFEQDKKTSLEDQRNRLKTIVFQSKLGSVYDKTERIAKLSVALAKLVGADEGKALRAGKLCKSDLVTNMVSEFDSMQGVAGYYYGLNDGETEEVALALNEQYLPRFSGDKLPTTQTGTLLALADRLDTLVGIFGIGQEPSGSKDPFALRRASLAVLRILLEKSFDLDLRHLLHLASDNYAQLPQGEAVVDRVLTYMMERFRSWYEDEGIPVEVFFAVQARKLSNPLDFDHRVRAVNQFRQLPNAEALASANKRVSNLLSKVDTPIESTVNPALLTETSEKELIKAIEQKSEQVLPLFANHNYTQGLSALAELRELVDAFFDNVMVMVDDPALRTNRLAILSQLRNLFLQVADVSLLVPANNQ